ncbi:MAG: DNA repair exonuclease [Acidobacteriota bacterium]
MTAAGEDDIMLKLLHTADWHLGRRFRSFPDEGALKLSRARFEVLDRVFLAADRFAVDAVLCAGDLFDEPNPAKESWEQAATRLRKHSSSKRPIFLLPGNHDPLTADSVWAQGHKFRSLLPEWIHVVDREDFEYTFANGAVLYAVPCMSSAGQRDPTESIPKRTSGDERIRVGMVHGSTFDAKDWQTNFPINSDAVLLRGLDYLAIGDTHGFRFIPPNREHPPTIYPGAPEATAFDEKDPGSVAVVFINQQRVATVRQERVARWTWEEQDITTLDELRTLVRRSNLDDRVLRLRVNMKVSAPEYDEAEVLLEDLQGTSARHAKVGVLELDRQGLELETATVDQYCQELPEVLRSAVTRLKIAAEDPAQRLVAERALFHLYRSSKRKAS